MAPKNDCEVTRLRAPEVKKGTYILINGAPGRVSECSRSQPGKHGGAKYRITARNLFTHRKMDTIVRACDDVDEVQVLRAEYQVVDMEDGFITVLKDNGEIDRNILVPKAKELLLKLSRQFESDNGAMVTVVHSMGKSVVVDCREAPLEE